MKLRLRACLYCKKEFNFLEGNRKFCSLRCHYENRKIKYSYGTIYRLFITESKKISDISQEIGCCQKKIREIIKECGLNEEKEEILCNRIMELYQKTGNALEISRIIGMSIPPVLRVLRKNKINTSMKGKSKPLQWRENIKKNHWTRGDKRDEIIKKSNTLEKSQKIRNSKIGKRRPDVSLLNKKLKTGTRQTENYMKFRREQTLPLKDSSIEIKIQEFLKFLHIEFLTHCWISEIKNRYQCDILIPSKRLIIECDGCYWHGCPICNLKINERVTKQIKDDKLRTEELTQRGYRVLRLWEHEIKPMNVKQFLEVFNGN